MLTALLYINGVHQLGQAPKTLGVYVDGQQLVAIRSGQDVMNENQIATLKAAAN